MKKVLIVSPVVSHPPLAGNSARIAQMVAVFQALGCEVHFLLCPIRLIQDMRDGDAMHRFYGARYRELNGGKVIGGNLVQKAWRFLLRKGLRRHAFAQDITFTSGIFPAKTRAEFRAIVEDIDPALLVFEYVLMAELADSLDNRRTKVVDTHDSFSNRNQRIRASGGAGMWWSLRPWQERRLLSRFDHALAIQQNEFDFFSGLLAGSKTNVKLVDALTQPQRRHTHNTPSNLVIGYIGSNNKHNIEGLEKFLAHQWPKIRAALPEARFLIAGGISFDQRIAGVRFLGKVNRLWEDFYERCSIVVNPCLSGTGLKIKTVEAMSYGIPVVTTTEGSSGIESAIGRGIYCCDISSASFHETCLMLLVDANQRMACGEMVRSYIQEKINRSNSELASLFQQAS
nr:glycosyltransferase [Variovorax boronicumulans]